MGSDTIQLKNVVSTISHEYLLEFTSDGAAKVSHFEINCRVLNIIPTSNLFCIFYIPSFNARWVSFSKRPRKNTSQCYTKPLDSLKNWNNRFFWVDDIVADWRTSAPKDQMPPVGSYSMADVTSLNTRRTPIQKQPEALLCLVGLSWRYILGDDVYPTFSYDDDRDMDLFSLISAPNHAKVKTETRPCASRSSGTPSTVEKSPLDFSNEDPPLLITESIGEEEQGQDELSQGAAPVRNPPYTRVALEPDLEKETVDMGALMSKMCRKRGVDEAEANAPPKVLRKDHVASHPHRVPSGGNHWLP
nr:hypothetical protein [Tanacetum cinerariifolium]